MKEKVGGEGDSFGGVLRTGADLTALHRAELQVVTELFNIP